VQFQALEARTVTDTTNMNELQLSVNQFRTQNETLRNENLAITTERDQMRLLNTTTTGALNRLQLDYNSLQTTKVAVIVERDQLRTSNARYRTRLINAEKRIANLYLNFPRISDILLSAGHQIDPRIVLTKDGRPDMRYTRGKPFCRFDNERSFVFHNGRRVCVMITTVSE